MESNVVCSFSTAVMLFLLAVAAVFLCGFAAYWLTRQQFETKMAALKYVPQPRRNLSQQSKEADMYEEEPPMDGPTVDELRLPRNLEPIWYNLTLKTYLPGVSAIANEKNLTTDGNIMIKLRVLSATDEIVLNAKDLTFPLDFTKARILTDEVVPAKFKRDATNDTSVRIYSRPEAVNSTTYALDTAVKALDLLQEYFGVPLKGDKQGFICIPCLDIFAVPTLDETSVSGQGIMFLPEEDLLLDASTNTAEQRVKIARAVTRALTRQKSYQTSDSLEPVLVDDARSSSHPLSLNIETPAEAEEILDQVTAEKGGAVLRMIRAVVGEETFQKGVQNFLTAHANGTANYTDFWDALDREIAGKLNAWDGNKLKTADFAEKWILQ
ncbi:peptidase family M1, partial [Ancylostoma duodenale]